MSKISRSHRKAWADDFIVAASSQIHHSQTMSLDRPLLVTAKEACHLLSCGSTLLYAMLADGRLERVRLGGRTTITMASIDRLIEAGKQA